ncbi:hypothetical protein [Delftia sp. PS-11]|uniref:hypothetical protein n=1 Tax=Delftia sp. PS-11 TaxID=2767222 RepID=UPI002457930F|nr:hypothetical protein [Delftia sp. PS-11]KAJ8741799.1 hypothetical protein H9T68_20775 [Delftia sp. PS-11]
MSDAPKVLSRAEAAAAKSILAALARLDAEQAERVLAHVQAELDQAEGGDVLFARGIAGPNGALDTCMKTWVDSGTAELFRRRAAMRNQNSSACQRDCIYLLVHEKTYTVMVAEKALHDADAMDLREHLTGPFAARKFWGPGR